MHGGPHYSGPSYFENQDYPVVFYFMTWFMVFVLWVIGFNLLLVKGKGKLKFDKSMISYKKSGFSKSRNITQSVVNISRSYENWNHDVEGLIWSLRLENEREIHFLVPNNADYLLESFLVKYFNHIYESSHH